MTLISAAAVWLALPPENHCKWKQWRNIKVKFFRRDFKLSNVKFDYVHFCAFRVTEMIPWKLFAWNCKALLHNLHKMQEEISRYQKKQKTKLAAVVNLKGGLIMLNSTLYLYSKTPQELCNFIHGKKAPRFIIRLKKAFLVRASLSLVFLTKSQLFSLPGCQICCFVTVTCISELLWCCHTHAVDWTPSSNVGKVWWCKWLSASGVLNLWLFCPCPLWAPVALTKKRDECEYGNELNF